jgi:dTDP-4-dehydrorhamnose reductase
MTKVIVFGSNGQVGSELKEMASSFPMLQTIFIDRQTISIEDYENLHSFLINEKPDFVINCAAYTKVDLAEKEVTNAMKINGYAVGHLAKTCQSINTKLIHISSDYTYDNGSRHPLKESDANLPKSIYAKSKLLGDRLALEFNPQTIILKTSWVYSFYGHNFVKTMIKLSLQRSELTIVDDQYGCPTSAQDIANTIYTIIYHITSNPDFDKYGIYNFANEGVTNWKAFAEEIFLLSNKEVTITGQSTVAYNAPAARPLWSMMNLGKIKSTFPITIHHWRDSLKIMLERYVE